MAAVAAAVALVTAAATKAARQKTTARKPLRQRQAVQQHALLQHNAQQQRAVAAVGNDMYGVDAGPPLQPGGDLVESAARPIDEINLDRRVELPDQGFLILNPEVDED